MSLNLAECIELSAAEHGDKTALVFGGWRMSYRELDVAARRAANMLRGLGVKPGDRVGLLLPNVPQFAMIYFGILYTGATAVTMNVLLKSREIRFRLRDAEIRTLVAFGPIAEEAIKAAADVPECALVVVEPGMKPEKPAAGQSFLQLMAGADDVFDMVQTNPDDVAAIIYSSATDGRPKGAQLTHFNLFQNAVVCKDYALGYYPEDICITVLPLFHGFGQTTMLNAPLLAGSTVVLLPQFEPGALLEAVQQEKATLLAVVPTMLHLLLQYRKAGDFDLSSLRCIISGGMATPRELREAAIERFGKPILEGYGLTETSPVVSWNPGAEKNRPGTLGVPIWGVRMRIRREDGAWADTGEVGEIVVRGHNVMKGYLNCPEADAQVFRDGWFHTGDLGFQDEEGYTHFTGLKKEMINRAGMNVYPREVEAVLREHPEVADAAVFGVPDPVRGEEVVACVVLKAGTSPDPRDVAAFVREQIAAYKAPRRIHVVDAIPRDGRGRPDTTALGHL